MVSLEMGRERPDGNYRGDVEMNENGETIGTKDKVRCACHAFYIETWTGEVPEDGDPNDYVEYTGTDCTQLTSRTFAPGHDARLKSLLIQAGAQGLGVRRELDGMATTSSAEQVATYFGFEHQVLSGVKRAQAKAMERAEKKAAKAQKAMAAQTSKEIAKRAAQDAKVAARAPRTQEQQKAEAKKGCEVEAQIKVGRHFYDAVISPNGTARYTTKADVAKTVESGKYKLVEPK